MDIDLLIEHDVRIRSVSCFEPSTKSRRLIENQKRSAKSVFSFIQQARYKYALEKRDCFSISKLLNKYDSNIQIENVNKYGENSLILAACEGYDAVVAKVLKYNTLNVNLKDNDGLTALMWCSKLGYTDTVSLLLASEGIDINICSTLNRNSALIFACMYGHTSVVSKLLNSPDINVNLKNKYGKTALMWASSEGHCDLVRMLLSRDDILVNLADIEGRTALMMASVQHHSNVVATLLESGLVDVNLQSVDKGTALIYATRLGFSDIVSQLLLVSSINVNLQNSYGNTALHSAVVRENVELTSLLLTHPEINIDVTNELGLCPISYANGNEAIIKLLIPTFAARIELREISEILFQEECSVCLEYIETDGRETICNHKFHYDCITRWLVNKDSCPCCRTPILK